MSPFTPSTAPDIDFLKAQARIAERNLVRIALEVEKLPGRTAAMHDLINDCLTSAALLREALGDSK